MTSHRSPAERARAILDERRVAPRLAPTAVPWITALRPNHAGSARMLNISKTGVLFDTRERLPPGRRATLIALTDDERSEKLPGLVVRSQVVAITPAAGLLYRTALAFDGDFPWELAIPEEVREPGQVEADRVVLPQEAPIDQPATAAGDVALEGPVDALFSTDRGSQVVAVTNLTETGCIVRTTELTKPGGWISLSILFSQSAKPLLTGRVTSITSDGRCLVRFMNLAAQDRHVLRMELRRQAVMRGRGAAAPHGTGQNARMSHGSSFGLTVSAQLVTGHAAEW
ncbi:MAG: PilZ domain-containing protein [Vicinamibacterales bacterium]